MNQLLLAAVKPIVVALIGLCMAIAQDTTPPVPEITQFSIVESATGIVIPGFEQVGVTDRVNLAALPDRNISLRPAADHVRSVQFTNLSSGEVTVANWPYLDYELNRSEVHADWKPGTGVRAIVAKPFSGFDATGEQGAETVTTFGVVNDFNRLDPLLLPDTGLEQRAVAGERTTISLAELMPTLGEATEVTLRSAPPFVSFDPSSGQLVVEPSPDDSGSYEVVLGLQGPPVPDVAGDLQLVFRDEFDAATIDRARWNTCYHWNLNGCTNEGNRELQWYLPENVILDEGLLKLQIQREPAGDYAYTSGMISSHWNFAFRYGYVEMRAKFPSGDGFWPAFWLLPGPFRGWPPEIDIAEVLGREPDVVHMTLHHLNDEGQHVPSTSEMRGPDFSTGFHHFAVDWQPDSLRWYVDGVEQFRLTDHIPDEPMYILANLALGGEWAGPPDADTPFPATYEIDYIRVWQRSEHLSTGIAGTDGSTGTVVSVLPHEAEKTLQLIVVAGS
jgi:beta-glucanase (GH16 family)